MNTPPGRCVAEVAVAGWQPQHTFGDFTTMRLREYYHFDDRSEAAQTP